MYVYIIYINIYMKNKNSYIPSSILNNGKCIAESITIANIFNYYIFSFSCTYKPIKNFSCKSFKDFLP